MLVDSKLERRTLDELLRLQSWVRNNKGIRLEIEKPYFDIAAEDDAADSEVAPREPCIPDFILRAKGSAARGTRTVPVETMGFADETYRARKRMMHDLMEGVADAPVVLHDFHFPEDRAQGARDRRFWLDARRPITGTDQAVSDARRPRTEEQGAYP
ncbi:MAG: hypothetical protein ACREFY_03360 [Acetobacteraceae bacterium]